MEAKLIKTKTGFYLWRNPLDKSQELLGATVPIMNDNGVDLREYKLSLKNCQAIERGYDLDELADECQNILIKDNWRESPSQKIAFTLGFQKALEILGDKKFSEDDMINFAEYCKGDLMKTKDLFNEYQSLQQNEWKVEIVEEDSKVVESHVWDGSNNGELTWKKQPKLDADGCIILKHKV